MSWLILIVAGLFEVVWAVALKMSNGFQNVAADVAFVAGIVLFGESAEAMATLKPDVVVLNACAAQLKTYGRLIMDDADVESVCRAAPNATVIASHMDTVAHASLTRKTLRAAGEALSKDCAIAIIHGKHTYDIDNAPA